MATNHTENYQLNLWEPTDSFLREEFNENTQKTDAVLARLDEFTQSICTAGSFTGTGSTPVEVNLGFRPKLVVFISNAPALVVLGEQRICAVYDSSSRLYIDTNKDMGVTLTSSGFRVRENLYYLNCKYNSGNCSVQYFAFR